MVPVRLQKRTTIPLVAIWISLGLANKFSLFFVCRPFIFAVEKRAKKNVNRLFQNQENIGSIEKPSTEASYGTSRPSVITGICAIRCALRLNKCSKGYCHLFCPSWAYLNSIFKLPCSLSPFPTELAYKYYALFADDHTEDVSASHRITLSAVPIFDQCFPLPSWRGIIVWS